MEATRSSAALAAALTLAASLVSPSLPAAQEAAAPEPRREGELQTFINPDAKDLNTKLDLLVHTLYEVNQRLVALTFTQRYGDRIRMERVMIPNAERDLTPGWIFKPVKMDAGKRYPAIVAVHGGFHFSLDEEFFGFLERFLSEGYVVIFPEYRGSRGYGPEHYHAQQYGAGDVADVLSAAELFASKPYVDPQRMGIVGRSRGGMLTLLAIEREPKRFKAAVDVVGLADFLAYMAYKPEYRRAEVARESQFKGLPFEDLDAYIDASPINNVDKIETPLLIHATRFDRTAPVRLHSERLIEVLKGAGKKFEYKIYDHAPGGHGYSDADSPEARDSLDKIVEFLGRHLK
jgi:dipeptidyl aminopeptidase/acylaminoacyl peptidase